MDTVLKMVHNWKIVPRQKSHLCNWQQVATLTWQSPDLRVFLPTVMFPLKQTDDTTDPGHIEDYEESLPRGAWYGVNYLELIVHMIPKMVTLH